MNKDNIESYLFDFGIKVNDDVLAMFDDFKNTTLQTNNLFNITSIKDDETFYEKMIFDSAISSIGLDLSDKKVIDVGTGGGFPGVILYFLNPTVELTLLDSTMKKISYLNSYCQANNYQIKCVCSRVEEYALDNREAYDFAFARALAPLNILLELIIPLLKIDGYFVALKGSNFQSEINDCKSAFKKLDCEIVEIKRYILPESKEERNILLIKKNAKTDKKYPRAYSKIKSKPL